MKLWILKRIQNQNTTRKKIIKDTLKKEYSHCDKREVIFRGIKGEIFPITLIEGTESSDMLDCVATVFGFKHRSHLKILNPKQIIQNCQ